MKTILKILSVLTIISLAIGCDKEEPTTGGSIHIDPTSTTAIPDEGTLNFKGSVKTKSGTTIDEISIMVLYRGIAKDEDTGKVEIKDIAELATNITTLHEGFTRKSKNEYEFYLTEKNKTIAVRRTEIYGIRVNVRMKNGERFSTTWPIRAQFKI